MWNYEYRWQYDDWSLNATAWEKRKGETITYTKNIAKWASYINRLYTEPMPTYPTPNNLRKSYILTINEPPQMKNQMMLSYRYLDTKKSDDTYVYLPTLRRVVRGESGQRSTPVAGSVQALDDYYGFDGKTSEFTYQLVGERKVLGISETKLNLKNLKIGEFPIPTENFELRDVYVIDIIPKDPKYPQSKKRIYIDKENVQIHYATAWDRAGKVWKIWNIDYTKKPPLPDGDIDHWYNGMIGIDEQFGLAGYHCVSTEAKITNNEYKYEEFLPSALLRRVK